MLTGRYLTTVANLPGIFRKIIEGVAPEKFNREHLAGIGFAGSNDRAVIPLLKELGFLTAEGSPTARYHAYRDKSQSAVVLGEAILEAYGDLFTINENPTSNDREAIEGKFKSTHNATDRVAQLQAATFLALLKLADIKGARKGASSLKGPQTDDEPEREREAVPTTVLAKPSAVGLRYNIEVHLPPTKDVEVYNAIFKALREHLLAD